MSQNENTILPHAGLNPARQLISALWKYRALWMIPTALCTILAVMVALFAPKTYMARQTLVIRDDMVGTMFKPGRFDSMDSMKSAQETILEISRRPQVIRKALEQLGPPHGTARRTWPSDLTIERTQGKIQISAPNGAEFGRTEAIVLSVKESSKQRAAKFIEVLLDEIETNLREFRALRFKSMGEELAQGTLVAKHAYEKAATELQGFENRFGADLGTLRSLNDSLTGSNALSGPLTEMMAERRAALAEVDLAQKQLDLLLEVQKDPTMLVTASQELLQLQPTLTSLIEGLNKALLRLSKNNGRYSENHPQVQSDRREIEDIKLKMHAELGSSIRSLQSQLSLRNQRYERLNEKIADYESRLGNLGKNRVEYQQLTEDVKKKQEIYGKSESQLAEIQSLGAAAYNVSLLTRVDKPQVAFNPVGPTKRMIVFGGMAAGLLIGLGLVIFFAPIEIGGPQPVLPQANVYQTSVQVPVGAPTSTYHGTASAEPALVQQPAHVLPPVAAPPKPQYVQPQLTQAAPAAATPPAPAPALATAPVTAPAAASNPVAAATRAPASAPASPTAPASESASASSSAPAAASPPVSAEAPPITQTVVPPATSKVSEAKTAFNQTGRRSAPTTVPIETKQGSSEAVDPDRSIRQSKTRQPSSAESSKPVELAYVAETPSGVESTSTDFKNPETKAMFDEIASRLQLAKQNQGSESESDEVHRIKESDKKRNSDLEIASQSALESLRKDQDDSGITRATVTETVPLESVSEPPPRKRSTPITEPRSSTRTEVFESPMPSDTAGNSTHVLSTDLPSDTSKSESSETPGLQKEMLHLQKTPDRRMAKTVDLRELKKQLSGKIKGDKKAVERSIASTIRACDRDDEIGDSRTSSAGKQENLSEQIARLTKSITDSWNRDDEASSDSSVEKSDPSGTETPEE